MQAGQGLGQPLARPLCLRHPQDGRRTSAEQPHPGPYPPAVLAAAALGVLGHAHLYPAGGGGVPPGVSTLASVSSSEDAILGPDTRRQESEKW